MGKMKGNLLIEFILSLLILIAVLSGGEATSRERGECEAELVKVPEKEMGRFFLDDGTWDSLKKAMQHSRHFFRSRPAMKDDAEGVLSPSRLRDTLEVLDRIVREDISKQELASLLRRHFDFYTLQRGSEDNGRMLVTGYFEPEFAGSLRMQPPYLYPLYGVPDDLVTSTGKKGGQRSWRLQDRMLYTYWNRRDIDDGSRLEGNELAYLADPIEVFILQVQGSGRIRLQDGSVRKIRYAANNGLPYRSIGKLLVDKGVMTVERASMPLIISYLQTHPEERDEILFQNDRYIFFRWDEKPENNLDDGPIGSMEEMLTADRSVALDSGCYPLGAIGVLRTRQPRFDAKGRLDSWVGLERLVFAQDTGSAISGPYRLDLFWGNGPYARHAAGVMRQEGTFWIMVAKSEE